MLQSERTLVRTPFAMYFYPPDEDTVLSLPTCHEVSSSSAGEPDRGWQHGNRGTLTPRQDRGTSGARPLRSVRVEMRQQEIPPDQAKR